MKERLRHIWSLGVKEIMGIGRDPLLIVLILYSFTFSVFVTAKASPDAIDHAAIAVVDEDRSALSQRITDAFLPPLFMKPVMLTMGEVDEVLDKGQYTFVVVIPPDFQEKVLADNDPEIQVNVDATRMAQAFTGNGYIQSIILKEVQAFVKESTRAPAAVYTAESLIRSRYNPNLTKSWKMAMSQVINNIAMIALILTGAALIRERERGTLEHLLVTPVNPVEIMIAKIWSMSLVVLAATGFSLLAVVNGVLGVPFAGSFWLFMFAVMINLFAMTSLGIFLACFAKDMPQLGILMILVLMPMQILSGGTTPQSSMPELIQYVMLFSPTTYFVEFSDAILFRGADFCAIWPTFLKMTLLGAGYFTVALKRFRKTVAG